MMAALAMFDYAGAARAAFGIGVISGIRTASLAGIEKAATGARITKSGVAQVHAGEIVVPATVVRQPRERFEQAMQPDKPSPIDQEDSILENLERPVFILQNPLVDNQDFWDEVVTEHYEEATRRLKKRLGKIE
jgi:hypothetical protein